MYAFWAEVIEQLLNKSSAVRTVLDRSFVHHENFNPESSTWIKSKFLSSILNRKLLKIPAFLLADFVYGKLLILYYGWQFVSFCVLDVHTWATGFFPRCDLLNCCWGGGGLVICCCCLVLYCCGDALVYWGSAGTGCDCQY